MIVVNPNDFATTYREPIAITSLQTRSPRAWGHDLIASAACRAIARYLAFMYICSRKNASVPCPSATNGKIVTVLAVQLEIRTVS